MEGGHFAIFLEHVRLLVNVADRSARGRTLANLQCMIDMCIKTGWSTSLVVHSVHVEWVKHARLYTAFLRTANLTFHAVNPWEE